MSKDPTPDAVELVARLRAKRYVRERWVEPVGTMDEPCDADDDGAEAVLRNPDGPAAADLIERQATRLDAMWEALEKVKAAIASLPEDGLGMARIAFGMPDDVYPIRDELLSEIETALKEQSR